MVYITGDTHGDISLFKNPKLRKLTEDDILLVCGDFGFLWDGSEKEKAAIEKLSKKKYTICFIDGAHENFEMLIPTMLRDKLSDVKIIDSKGLDFTKYEIDGKIIMVSHGQNDSMTKVISDFSKMFKVVPNEVHLGHTHSYTDINDCDIKVTVNGSLIGSDDYAITIRKVTTPSQNLIVYEKDRCIYEIKAE